MTDQPPADDRRRAVRMPPPGDDLSRRLAVMEEHLGDHLDALIAARVTEIVEPFVSSRQAIYDALTALRLQLTGLEAKVVDHHAWIVRDQAEAEAAAHKRDADERAAAVAAAVEEGRRQAVEAQRSAVEEVRARRAAKSNRTVPAITSIISGLVLVGLTIAIDARDHALAPGSPISIALTLWTVAAALLVALYIRS